MFKHFHKCRRQWKNFFKCKSWEEAITKFSNRVCSVRLIRLKVKIMAESFFSLKQNYNLVIS